MSHPVPTHDPENERAEDSKFAPVSAKKANMAKKMSMKDIIASARTKHPERFLNKKQQSERAKDINSHMGKIKPLSSNEQTSYQHRTGRGYHE